MNRAAVAVVDEEEAHAQKTILHSILTDTFEDGDLIVVEPQSNLDDMIARIIDSGCSALVTDFLLRENMPNVEYSGVELIQGIRTNRLGFPCFLATAYAPEALKKRIDPNRIYSKKEIWSNRQDGEVHFFDKVLADIREWEDGLSAAAHEHAILRERSRSQKLEPNDLTRLIELDTFLEGRMLATDLQEASLKQDAVSTFGEISKTAEELLDALESAIEATKAKDGSTQEPSN